MPKSQAMGQIQAKFPVIFPVIQNLYARAMLEGAFRDFRNMTIVEEEVEIYEGTSHGGMSAVINFTARK